MNGSRIARAVVVLAVIAIVGWLVAVLLSSSLLSSPTSGSGEGDIRPPTTTDW